MMEEKCLIDLFESNAITVCKPDSPFWRSGGRLAAIMMHCQYLLGNASKANSMIALVETAKDCPMLIHRILESRCMEAYEENGAYRHVMDCFAQMIRECPGFEGYTHIAGIEGASLLLSVLMAKLLGKPHLMVFQSKEIYLYADGKSSRAEKLDHAKILFVTDFFAENSGFFKTWLPAIHTLGDNTLFAAALLDRHIGGSDRLIGEGVFCDAVFDINEAFFSAALQERLISAEQFSFLKRYLEDSHQCMVEFLADHPEFLQKSLESSDPVVAERAKLCIQRGLYQLSQPK